MSQWAHDQEILLIDKGMFSTKFSLAKGIQSKTRAAHSSQKFFWVPTHPRALPIYTDL